MTAGRVQGLPVITRDDTGHLSIEWDRDDATYAECSRDVIEDAVAVCNRLADLRAHVEDAAERARHAKEVAGRDGAALLFTVLTARHKALRDVLDLLDSGGSDV